MEVAILSYLWLRQIILFGVSYILVCPELNESVMLVVIASKFIFLAVLFMFIHSVFRPQGKMFENIFSAKR